MVVGLGIGFRPAVHLRRGARAVLRRRVHGCRSRSRCSGRAVRVHADLEQARVHLHGSLAVAVEDEQFSQRPVLPSAAQRMAERAARQVMRQSRWIGHHAAGGGYDDPLQLFVGFPFGSAAHVGLDHPPRLEQCGQGLRARRNRWEPNEELDAVIVTAAARMVSNPTGLAHDLTSGPFSHSLRGAFQGWTLAELFVLNRYRKRAV